MRITHEADYAIRIVYCLAVHNCKIGAKEIAEETGVPVRFALKILRKLILNDLVCSFKGANGGYQIVRPVEQISIGEVIEVIDGPIRINHCLESGFDCSRFAQKGMCNFHQVFSSINSDIRSRLYAVSFDQLMPDVKE